MEIKITLMTAPTIAAAMQAKNVRVMRSAKRVCAMVAVASLVVLMRSVHLGSSVLQGTVLTGIILSPLRQTTVATVCLNQGKSVTWV